MANTKKMLAKAATKFRRTEPYLHSLYTLAIAHMAYYIKKSGAPEVTVEISDGKISDCYAND